ncbi:MAG: YbhB/YbcL family Raf kinase inhibitor-like protein [Anaerolineales bacterium]|nr:YbhB/YbcL family Raf kinase inhibitor-like protein [Anaerolineales bacterium]
MSIQITSAAFSEGETIPRKFTCDAENISPPLQWSGVPAEAKSLVLIMDDPDAPVGTWVHWIVFDLSPQASGLAEGVSGVGVQGVNSFRKLGYGGPCPPRGAPHRYYFKLYALDLLLALPQGTSKAEVEKAMQGHVLAEGQLMGKYGR